MMLLLSANTAAIFPRLPPERLKCAPSERLKCSQLSGQHTNLNPRLTTDTALACSLTRRNLTHGLNRTAGVRSNCTPLLVVVFGGVLAVDEHRTPSLSPCDHECDHAESWRRIRVYWRGRR